MPKTVRKKRWVSGPIPTVEPFEPGVWITMADAQRILGRTADAVLKLARAGYIRVHQPPGLLARYSRDDCNKYRPGASATG